MSYEYGKFINFRRISPTFMSESNHDEEKSNLNFLSQLNIDNVDLQRSLLRAFVNPKDLSGSLLAAAQKHILAKAFGMTKPDSFVYQTREDDFNKYIDARFSNPDDTLKDVVNAQKILFKLGTAIGLDLNDPEDFSPYITQRETAIQTAVTCSRGEDFRHDFQQVFSRAIEFGIGLKTDPNKIYLPQATVRGKRKII